MTKPKFPINAETIHHTRYTLEGFCLCAPRPALTNTAGYLFALACARHGQLPHAEMLMPDGRSGVLSDCSACRADFFRDYHVWLAIQWGGKVLDRDDGIWNKKAPGDKPCVEPGDVVGAMLHTWLLPVKHGLVERASDWPGFKIMPDDWGETMTFSRPPDAPAHWPPVIEVTPQPPAEYRHWPLDEVKKHFNDMIREREKAHEKRRRAEGKKVLGKGKCLSIPTRLRIDRPHETPRGWKARNTTLLDLVRAEFDDKHRQYEDGRLDLQKGRTDHVFPAGTFKLTRQFDITVAPTPAKPLTVIHAVVPRARAPG